MKNNDILRLGPAAVVAAALLAPAVSRAQSPAAAAGVRRMSADAAAAAVAAKADGLVTAPLPVGAGVNGIVVGRDRSGQVEVHEALADAIIGQAGEAAMLVGGRVTGQTHTAPQEWRGGTITGGEEVPLRPGDIIWIPAGVPHQLIMKTGDRVQYVTFKFRAAGQP